jgi:hypothetical protein
MTILRFKTIAKVFILCTFYEAEVFFLQLSLSILLSFIYLVNCQRQPPSIGNENIAEDQKFLHDTIAQYGPPADYKKLGLPGPEIYADRAKYLLSNVLTGGELGTYSFR